MKKIKQLFCKHKKIKKINIFTPSYDGYKIGYRCWECIACGKQFNRENYIKYATGKEIIHKRKQNG